MIVTSPIAKTSALAIAVAVHAAVGWAAFSAEETQIEGQTGAAEAAIGGSFADLAAGTLVAEPVKQQEMVRPEPAIEASPQKPTQPVATAQPVPIPAETPLVQPIKAPTYTTPLPADIAPAATSEALTPIPVPPTASAPIPAPTVPVEAMPTARPTQALAVESTQALERQVEPDLVASASTQPLGRSLRPAARPEHVKRANTPRHAAKQPTAQSARGNSTQNAHAGSATGSRQATAARQATASGQAQDSGNAAASNYPGQVMRKIARVPKPRVDARGTAIIRFSISGSGGLSGASVAQSSGSAALDQAALRVIRRAAPFPPPPTGARRSFSIRIEGAS
ncbi:TonB family protein [Aestuariivita sp.]|jgi:protein TonB|uniref:energy transducer TonB family protein n=1 Tax=Aestuariivita sp. TaxID=1872407 RepID=UPI002174352A|nr:TonB family protein [Aestuariivita sp.]MCE8006149.1 TonB family protein [Aestuariivita sp.]